ncbi:hypothetical protein DRQ15_07185 [candidate division KSB1 bacterium]|nr:MAG: hypothetical protein B5M50_06285 [candidate division KSB1 bacterium 4484_219]RKY77644.1 MAG: hypothetical protein DRQ12_07840 [candidate division KSB1 bacterium]RKY84229.1 MAG: hypothetical protein DRQ11_11870 [candidate division KSB1 bacterium]RKY90542.1 MAG: hypothetical protein DRQ15_07185 [candidate division KSB1 bacterium]HDI52154.1 hypothetical protein [Bacteroidota bacterium]
MKKLIYVDCTSAYKYPERPRSLLVKGKRYPIHRVLRMAKIQSRHTPSFTTHYFQVELEDGRLVELDYEEKTKEWYLRNYEEFIKH